MRINNIPVNIGEFLAYDETSPSGLRWINARSNINVGDPAGCLDNSTNYYRTIFAGKKYLNHRIIFFLNFGYCPDCIDHIDGNSQNNKISNIREASKSQNNCNRKFVKNSSGHKGVYRHSSGKYQYWRVRIWKNSKSISKQFPLSEFQQACDFSDEHRKILHGDFANDGI